MKVSEFILRGRERLAEAKLECADPLLHMKQIVEYGLGIDGARLYLRWDEELDADDLRRLEGIVRRRLTGEPFQYIAAHEWFWDSKFLVGPGVLIPRRETELLVETLLRREDREVVRVAELGGGTGCIGISVLLERTKWEWHAFENNPKSLPYLQENRRELLPRDARYFIHDVDYFSGAAAGAPYDWIVTNPPYVPSGDWEGLSREVRHEPREALDGGGDGLDIIERLITGARSLLSTGGGFLCEMDARQSAPVEHLLAENGFEEIEILKDYAGLDRVALGRRKED